MISSDDIHALITAGRGGSSPARVVDPNPLNWLYGTYNTVEEPVRGCAPRM
ncbi:MAG: hypothetical protein L0H64_20275 [Pseudonocardia sp.]|nr:hypothetical protein [Pseudonocardia sp.]